jgi:hypothetical protein
VPRACFMALARSLLSGKCISCTLALRLSSARFYRFVRFDGLGEHGDRRTPRRRLPPMRRYP